MVMQPVNAGCDMNVQVGSHGARETAQRLPRSGMCQSCHARVIMFLRCKVCGCLEYPSGCTNPW